MWCAGEAVETKMPEPKRLLNAFTPRELHEITGLSMPMIDYLLRMNYLKPAYGHGDRGKVRYYSYRDLVVARIVQKLRDTGVELSKLKSAIQMLSSDAAWLKRNRRPELTPLRWLVTDGKEVLLKYEDGFLDELRPRGQRSFAFVVNLRSIQREVKNRVPQQKRKHFTMDNIALIPDTSKKPKKIRNVI